MFGYARVTFSKQFANGTNESFFVSLPNGFSYSQLGLETTRSAVKKFDIPSKLDSFLLFQEDCDRPAAKLSMADLPYSTLKDVIETNKYLQLPRLASQVRCINPYLTDVTAIYPGSRKC